MSDETPTISEVTQPPYAIITTYGTNIAQMEADARLQFCGLFNVPGENIGISQTGPARVSETAPPPVWECDWHGWVKR